MGDRGKKLHPEDQAFILLQIIDSLPYPLVIFDKQLNVTMVNHAFENAANASCVLPLPQTFRILPDRISDPQLAACFTKVFQGDTIFSEGMRSPFEMFSEFEERKDALPDNIYRVEVSPMPAEDKTITHGVIMYITKKQQDKKG